MGLLKRFIRNDLADLHRSNVRVRIIGLRRNLSADLQGLLTEAEELTRRNSGLTLVVAFKLRRPAGDRRGRPQTGAGSGGWTARRRDDR